jgi:hypothetical protein
MSLLSWLFPEPKHAKAAAAADSSGLSHADATRPVSGRRGASAKDAAGNAQPANRKGERMARRELLYSVVRESMTRAGVLSASYKFKVLSLDARGRQFLVMVDLARAYGSDTGRLAEIEAMVAQAAKARYDIVVTAVYWRMHEHVAVGIPGKAPARGTASQPVPLESQPDALESTPAILDSGPAPLQPHPLAPVRAGARYEPIEADEVAAFKKALAAGSKPAPLAPSAAKPAAAGAAAATGAAKQQPDAPGKQGPHSYTLLTGFEDTEMPDQDVRAPALSGTQYGELN